MDGGGSGQHQHGGLGPAERGRLAGEGPGVGDQVGRVGAVGPERDHLVPDRQQALVVRGSVTDGGDHPGRLEAELHREVAGVSGTAVQAGVDRVHPRRAQGDQRLAGARVGKLHLLHLEDLGAAERGRHDATSEGGHVRPNPGGGGWHSD
jgi:hypothetical protein